MGFYERDEEVARLRDLLDAAAAGAGKLALVEGAPGIGKTALLDAIRHSARDRGFRVLTATGGELETELPFGLVRQLLEPAVATAGPHLLEGAAGLAAPVFGRTSALPAAVGGEVHGLYWLCSNLAETAPLLLTVDDVHWADASSLRFLSHLARRIGDLPVLLLLAGRPRTANCALTRMIDGLEPVVLMLESLSGQAVSRLVRERMSPDAEDDFCLACAHASGGNPFLLHEAISALQAEHVPPVNAEAHRVAALTPERLSTAVLERVARFGPDALRLARALAVLGPCADIRRPALLAGLDQARAADAFDALAAESIVTRTYPAMFMHPLVRSAVYADGTDARRAEDHRRAAQLLRAEGAPLEDFAPHLAASAPAGEPEVVRLLRSAAAQASNTGAAETAAGYLRRAIAEPAAATESAALHAELGRTLGMANRPAEAAQAVWTAFDLTEDPVTRAQLALDVGTFMMQTGRTAEALRAFETARTAVGEGELPLRLTTAFAMAAIVTMQPPASWLGRLDALADRVPEDSDAGRMLLGALAFGACATGDRPAASVRDLAARAARGPLPAQDPWLLVNFAGTALAIADRLPEALALLDRGIEHARQHGDLAQFRYLSVLRSKTALFAGRLLEAEDYGRGALAQHQIEAGHELPLAAAVLVDALVERNRLDEAQAVLIQNDLEQPRDMGMLIGHFVQMARARLRLRQQRPQEALGDLLRCGEGLLTAGCGNPAFASWRAEAALAHLALGQRGAARDLAAQDLDLAERFQAPHALGVALRTRGLVEGGATGLDLLAASVEKLRDSTCMLELARSLVEYGAALRRAGYKIDSRAQLKQGLDVSTRCHAEALAAQARTELGAAGARPRRDASTGIDSLTSRELHVAQMAAAGQTNRAIAQGLVVSLRTIEMHLTNVYRKLGITSREQLRGLMTAELERRAPESHRAA